MQCQRPKSSWRSWTHRSVESTVFGKRGRIGPFWFLTTLTTLWLTFEVSSLWVVEVVFFFLFLVGSFLKWWFSLCVYFFVFQRSLRWCISVVGFFVWEKASRMRYLGRTELDRSPTLEIVGTSLKLTLLIMYIPSRELTYPPKMAFWRWFSELPKVGYVNSLEGIYIFFKRFFLISF